jgi:uncharacterized protein (TIGR00725 family)
MSKGIQIGVLGASSCGPEIEEAAYEVGKEIARQGATLLCGGLGGVMEAAARGAKDAGGLTVGILPGASASEANPYIDLRIVTDMGHARNVVLVRSADAVIAVSGGYGTLSEIAIARKVGVPCIGLHTWDIDPCVVQADGPGQAVRQAMGRIQERGAG